MVTARCLSRLGRGGVTWGKDVLAFGIPLVTAARGAEVTIGDRVRIVSGSRATPLGVNHRSVIRALRAGSRITIGPDTGISGGSIIALYSITIGARCLIGANVTIFDTDFHPVADPLRYRASPPEPVPSDAVVIGDNVFIGTGSMIMKGVHLGENCVIGAGSVVTSSFPAHSVAAGNPARLIGDVEPQA